MQTLFQRPVQATLFAFAFSVITAPLPAQTSGLAVGPTQLIFNAQSTSQQITPQNLLVYSPSGAPVNFTVTANSPGGWLSVSQNSGVTPQAIIVTVNSGNVMQGANSGSITVSGGGSTITVPVTLNVNTNGTAPVAANPSRLTFSFLPNSVTPAVQQVVITSNSSSSLEFSASAATSGTTGWLFVTPGLSTTGPTGSTVTVTVNPAGLNPGTYSGTITIMPGSLAGLTIPVTVTVAPQSSLSVYPQQLGFAYQTGTTAPGTLTINLLNGATGGSVNYTATTTSTCGTSALTVSPASGAFPGALSVGLNTSNLQPQSCTGTITITPADGSAPLSIPVSILVSNSPLLLVPTSPVNFNYQVGANTPASQTVQIGSSSTPLGYSITASPLANGPNFLTVSSSTGTTPQGLTLGVNPTVLQGLAPNTYAELVTVTSPNAGNPAQTFLVTLTVSNSPSLLTNLQAVTFNYQVGQAAPQAQVVSVSSTGTPTPYSAAVTTTSCTGFLSANQSQSSTPTQNNQNSSVSLSVNTAGLTTPQTCSGTLTLTTPGSTTPVTIPVTLNVVTAAVINASPAIITLNAAAGAAATTAQIQLSSTDNATALGFTASASTTGTATGWLSVSPAAGSTPGNLTVTMTPGSLGAGTYSGAITIKGTSGNSPTITIPVIMTIGSGALTVTPGSISFSQVYGGAAPANQSITVNGLPSGVTLGASATSLTGSNLFTVNANGNTINVTPNGSLAPGSYRGVITVLAPGAVNSPFYIPVSFTVTGSVNFNLQPGSVTFNYVAGSALPNPQQVNVTSGNATVPFTAVAVAPSGSNAGTVFVNVTSTGPTPGVITISLDPNVTPTLGPGKYTNLINIGTTGTSAAPGILVTLNVTAASTNGGMAVERSNRWFERGGEQSVR